MESLKDVGDLSGIARTCWSIQKAIEGLDAEEKRKGYKGGERKAAAVLQNKSECIRASMGEVSAAYKEVAAQFAETEAGEDKSKKQFVESSTLQSLEDRLKNEPQAVKGAEEELEVCQRKLAAVEACVEETRRRDEELKQEVDNAKTKLAAQAIRPSATADIAAASADAQRLLAVVEAMPSTQAEKVPRLL